MIWSIGAFGASAEIRADPVGAYQPTRSPRAEMAARPRAPAARIPLEEREEAEDDQPRRAGWDDRATPNFHSSAARDMPTIPSAVMSSASAPFSGTRDRPAVHESTRRSWGRLSSARELRHHLLRQVGLDCPCLSGMRISTFAPSCRSSALGVRLGGLCRAPPDPVDLRGWS